MKIIKPGVFFLIIAINIQTCMSQSVTTYDIFSLEVPKEFIVKDNNDKLFFEKAEGNSFCQLHTWPAQQGSPDPVLNFFTGRQHFAATSYYLTTLPEKPKRIAAATN